MGRVKEGEGRSRGVERSEQGVSGEGRVVFDVFILRNRFAICVKWCYWGSRCNENFVLYIEQTARGAGLGEEEEEGGKVEEEEKGKPESRG